MKTGYDKIVDFTNGLRFYELWRGISNAFMGFLERILIAIGWYHPDDKEGE